MQCFCVSPVRVGPTFVAHWMLKRIRFFILFCPILSLSRSICEFVFDCDCAFQRAKLPSVTSITDAIVASSTIKSRWGNVKLANKATEKYFYLRGKEKREREIFIIFFAHKEVFRSICRTCFTFINLLFKCLPLLIYWHKRRCCVRLLVRIVHIHIHFIQLFHKK